MYFWILRAFLSVMLSLAVFLALALFVAVSAINGLFDAKVYVEALEEINIYERFYSEGLTPEAMEEIQATFLGEADVIPEGKVLELIQTAAPPEYLKAQIEGNLAALEGFYSGDAEHLSLYWNLEEPLERLATAAPPLVADIVEAKLEEAADLPALQPDRIAGEAEKLVGEERAEDIAAAVESLLAGETFAHSVADLSGLEESEILAVYDQSVTKILDNPDIDRRHREVIEEASAELKETFTTGNVQGFLTQAAEKATGTALELALAEIRTELDEQGRLDLTPILAEAVFAVEYNQFQATAVERRDRVRSYIFRLRLAAFAIGIAAMILAAFVYWRRVDAFILWLYLTLFLTGAATLALLLAAYSIAPSAIEDLAYRLPEEGPQVFTGLYELGLEAGAAVVSSQLAGLIWIPTMPMLAGIALGLATLAFNKWWRTSVSDGPEPQLVADSEPAQLVDN